MGRKLVRVDTLEDTINFKVVCDETNNSVEEQENRIMNIDVFIPVSQFNKDELEKALEDENAKIVASAGILKHMSCPDENDGGIGKGKL